MLFMNTWEIDEAVIQNQGRPVLGKASLFLLQLRDEVNRVSDGWHSWPLPARAAKQLMELVQGKLPAEESSYRKALSPIKSFYTRHGKAAGMRWPEV